MSNYNKLTSAETERLALLAEECGEVVQIVGKVLRHGYDNANPKDPEYITNREKLVTEIGDLLVVLNYIFEAKDITEEDVEKRIEFKKVEIKKWLHHQEEE